MQAFSYAGLQGDRTARGVSATLASTVAPSVSDGHVGGWIGLGGTSTGPGGTAEWLQTGLAAFPGDQTMQMYYEVTLAGSKPRYVELDSTSRPASATTSPCSRCCTVRRGGECGSTVSREPADHLAGSNASWYPQAVAESWNGGNAACNGYAYRFTNVTLATADGGKWRPLQSSYEFHDAGSARLYIPPSRAASSRRA